MTTRKLLLIVIALGVAAGTRAQNLKSWDDQINGSSRWKVLSDFNDEAVLDKETGLVWEKTPNTGQAPTFALGCGLCLVKNVGGRKGWRLPTIFELMSLVDPSQSNPSLPLGHPFPNMTGLTVWSSTTVDENTANAYAVIFSFGSLVQVAKTNLRPIWCVRGPGGSPHQY